MDVHDAHSVTGPDLTRLADRLDAVFSAMAGQRLLITGGAGFLGYYLVQAPLAWNRLHGDVDPIDVTVHDTFPRGVPDWLAACEGPSLTLRTRDVLEPLPADEAPFDWIIHAASIASPIFYRQYPIETMDANVLGLRIILDHMRERSATGSPLSGMLFFSTSEIYGDPDPAFIPTPETYRGSVSCTGPRACYDESKRYGETLCANFAKAYDLPIGVARPFNNYGPGLRIDDGRVLPDFARDVLNGRDITILSDGSATRTFCYVADAVAGYYLILGNAARYPGEAFNIGTDAPELSMAELADRVVAVGRELCDYDGQVTRAVSEDPDYLVDNPNRRCPVLDKARSMLGYEPEIGIDEGLRKALSWYIAEGQR